MSIKLKKSEEEKLKKGISKIVKKNNKSETKEERSEFGKGLVVCLAKFRSHYDNSLFQNASFCNMVIKKKSEKEKKEMAEGTAGSENTYDKRLMDYWKYFYKKTKEIYDIDYKKSLSSDLSMFMSGASDHLYNIEVPKIFIGSRIEDMVKELQDKALDIGHGSRMMSGDITFDEVWYLFDLTDKILLAIDQQLGLNADIGEYA
jgi:hypothetical protein